MKTIVTKRMLAVGIRSLWITGCMNVPVKPNNAVLRCGRTLFVCMAVIAVGTVFGAGLGPSNYVQDGLVTQFDGIDNANTGMHDAEAVVWKDLKGSAAVDVKNGYPFGERWFTSSLGGHTISGMPVLQSSPISVEVCLNLLSTSSTTEKDSYPFIFKSSNVGLHNAGVNKASKSTVRNFRWFVNGTDPRPNVTGVWTNTISCVSDSRNIRIYKDATITESNAAKPAKENGTSWTFNSVEAGVKMQSHYFAFRVYSRGLTDDEVAHNAIVDQLRFLGPRFSGGNVAWSEVVWTGGYGEPKTVSAKTNSCVTIVNAAVSVAVGDKVALKALSLEDGASLNLAAGAVAVVRRLFVEGVEIPRGIYSAESWLSGSGTVRVAGDLQMAFPEVNVVPGQDGWYEFGDGYMNTDWKKGLGFTEGECTKLFTGKRQCVKGQLVDWSKLAFIPGAKLRLVGGVCMNTIPAGWFDEIDLSQVSRIVVWTDKVFSDDRKLVLPSTAAFRWQPGNWRRDDETGYCWLVDGVPTDWTTRKFSEPIECNGILRHQGDSTLMNPIWLQGAIFGSGELLASNFGRQIVFDVPQFGFTGKLTAASNGSCIEIRADEVTGEVGSMKMNACTEASYKTHASFCASGLRFGPRKATSSPCVLKIGELTAGAADVADTKGKRWRNGSTVIVWGGATVHVGTLHSSVHVVALKGDQNCTNNRFNDATPFGTGTFVADTVDDKANLFLSTNISARVGTVKGNTCFNYTFQSNAVNRMTLDVTGSCSTSATIYATDLAMLPARVSGFKGTVTLRDVKAHEGDSYSMTVDFNQKLYTTDGCIGSGTLSKSPSRGIVEVTLLGVPKNGAYSLFRFDRAVDASGQPLFRDWTVNVAGHEGEDRFVFGSGADMKLVTVKRDETGLWLKISDSGLKVILK